MNKFGSKIGTLSVIDIRSILNLSFISMNLHKIQENGPEGIDTTAGVVSTWAPQQARTDILGSDCETSSEKWWQPDIDLGCMDSRTRPWCPGWELPRKESYIDLGTDPCYCFWYPRHTSYRRYVRMIPCIELVWYTPNNKSSTRIFLYFMVLSRKIWA